MLYKFCLAFFGMQVELALFVIKAALIVVGEQVLYEEALVYHVIIGLEFSGCELKLNPQIYYPCK
jgi:hypothetical protein